MAGLEAPTTVSVPSSDLINYRFDQADKRFAEMGAKLDTLLLQNQHYVTEERVNVMITEALKPTNETFALHRWYWRAVLSAILLSLGTAIVSLFTKGFK